MPTKSMYIHSFWILTLKLEIYLFQINMSHIKFIINFLYKNVYFPTRTRVLNPYFKSYNSYSWFIYILSPSRTLAIITLYNFLSFFAVTKFCNSTISPKSYSSINSLKRCPFSFRSVLSLAQLSNIISTFAIAISTSWCLVWRHFSFPFLSKTILPSCSVHTIISILL